MKNPLFFIITLLLIALAEFAVCQQVLMPESVVYDAPRNRYLISTINNTDIFIYDGTSPYGTFVSGLGSPRGMTIVGNNLYIADDKYVKGYNLATGVQIMNLYISGSSSLHDIVSDSNQYLYVTDRGNNLIIRVNYKNNTYSTFISSGLKFPDALLYDGANNRLIVCSDTANSKILSINLSNATVSTIITTNLNNLSGITRDDSGFVYVSCWGDNTVYRFSSDFSTGPVQYASGFNGPSDIFYCTDTKVLVVPDMYNKQLYFKDMLYPEIFPQGKTDICPGADILLKTINGAGLTYVWKRNSVNIGTSSTCLVYQEGSYTVSITNHLGTKTSSAVQINLYPKPIMPTINIFFGNPSFCLGDSVILEGPASYTYFWSDSQTTQRIIVKKTGSYRLWVFDTNNCMSDPSGYVHTKLNPDITKPTIIVDNHKTHFCRGDSVILEAPQGYNYLWSNGKTTQKIMVKDNLTISLIIYDHNYCQSYPSDSVKIEVYENPPKPVLNITGDKIFCNGDSAIVSAPSGYTDYLWNDNLKNPVRKVVLSDTLFVVVIDSNGCKSDISDTVIFHVNDNPLKPIIQYSGNLAFCEGDSIELHAPPGFIKYFWNNQQGNDKIVVRNSDTFLLYVIDSNHCKSPVSDMLITLSRKNPDKPDIMILYGQKKFCEGDSVILYALQNYSAYYWSNGVTKRQITVKKSDTLSLKVFDNFGCQNISDTIMIVVQKILERPQVLRLNKDSIYCSVEGTSYKWFFNNLTLAFMSRAIPIIGDGSYRVLVFNDNCASDTSDSYNYVAGSIGEDVDDWIKLFPNPSSGLIKIEVNARNSIDSWQITDLTGKILMADLFFMPKKQVEVKLDDLPSGTYLLVLQGNQKKISKILIKF